MPTPLIKVPHCHRRHHIHPRRALFETRLAKLESVAKFIAAAAEAFTAAGFEVQTTRIATNLALKSGVMLPTRQYARRAPRHR